MTKTQEVVLRMQVDNLSLEVERQNEQVGVLIDAANIMKDKIKNLETTADLNHTTIMELQSQNLQLTAIVQNHARFLKAGEDDYDLLAAENKENLRGYIRSTIKSDAYISAGTFSLSGLD
jgi:hypothetical protein